MALPETARDRDKSLKAGEEYRRLRAELDRAYQEWEKAEEICAEMEQ